MKCSKLYVIGKKRITVHWCGVITLVVLVTAFVIAERMYGPF
jgi:hypothetical protein